MRRAKTTYRPPVTLNCAQCRIDFETKPSLASAKLYCSLGCKRDALRGRPWQPRLIRAIPYTCAECGKTWSDKPSLRHRKKFCSRTCVGMATIRRLATLSPTSIETAVYQALAEMGIMFEPQARLGAALVDAFLPAINTVVECQGDFYHCNPATYKTGPTHAVQRKTMARDLLRTAKLEAAGYRVVALWEADIRNKGARTLLEATL